MAPKANTISDIMEEAYRSDPVARAWLEGYATALRQSRKEAAK